MFGATCAILACHIALTDKEVLQAIAVPDCHILSSSSSATLLYACTAFVRQRASASTTGAASCQPPPRSALRSLGSANQSRLVTRARASSSETFVLD